MKIIEAWGTGLGRIRNSCKGYELPEPVIEEFGDGFRAVLGEKWCMQIKMQGVA